MTPISPGTLLAGRFRLEDLLEETAGARFWRATDLTLMRDVAVHVLDAGDGRSQALLQAARASATVSGPHLLRVLDAAVEDGVAYVVNEWGNGGSLDRMLLEGPLPPRQAAWMVREVAEAVAGAHQQGVAHGRLIPENVMVNENGSVKLIGFVVDGVLHGGRDPSLTPEQDDVRNLGGLLYASLTGRWPGTPGTSLPAAPMDHGRVLRARQVRAGVPRRLDRICDNVLNLAETDFPIESAYEIKAALADFLGEVGEGLPAGRQAESSTEATELISLPVVADPEATQAAMPLFIDDDVPAALDDDTASTPVGASAPAEPTVVERVQPSSKTPYVGMGGGRAPSAWGPDVRGEPVGSDPTEWEGDTSGTSWLRLAALVATAVVILVAVVIAFNLGRGSGGGDTSEEVPESPGTSAPRTVALEPASVVDFDPFQDGGTKEENPSRVPAAYDGNDATAWQTSTYIDGPDITAYKPGVGLLVDLGSEEPVSEVRLRLVGSPTRVELLAAPPGSDKPTTTDGLDRVAVSDDAGTSLSLTPRDDVTARYVVIWLTALPPVSGGYRGGVSEFVVRS